MLSVKVYFDDDYYHGNKKAGEASGLVLENQHEPKDISWFCMF